MSPEPAARGPRGPVGPVGLVSSPLFLRHDTGPGHFERAERLHALAARLASDGLASECAPLDAPQAPREALLRVHPERHLEHVEGAIARGARVLDHGDTRVSADSWRAALAAAGGALAAVDRVVSREWSAGFVACRPPGHHAEADEAMGFCLLNNAALAARHAQAAHGLARVAIVDWDVHHGNGTQHVFEDDPSVLYASLHQYPHYPGTGAASERGRGAGEGATLNCPMDSGTGDAEWLAAFEDEVLPALEAFRPELVIVSAGFDAHARDPLSGTRLTETAYARMTEGLLAVAERHASGRLVSLLEGGYDLEGLSASAAAHLAVLCARAG